MHVLLSIPFLYSAFEKLMGNRHKYRTYLDTHLRPQPHARILDIGCGTADILDLLPAEATYVGVDRDEEYIRFAQERHGRRPRTTFLARAVEELPGTFTSCFDIVLADGVLHHLDDRQADSLFRTAHQALDAGGVLLTVDPTRWAGQTRVARWIADLDRGAHVREPLAYRDLARSVFPDLECHLWRRVGRRPQDCCLLKCYRGEEEGQ